MPSLVCTTTGTSAASERNTTFATSPKPNHTEISGIHANSDTCLKVLKLGPIARLASFETPSSAPSARPAAVPIAKPVSSRASDADSARHSAPLAAWSIAVCQHLHGRHHDAVRGARVARDIPPRGERHERQHPAAPSAGRLIGAGEVSGFEFE